jgi:lysophospholipid acyltransferase (LPLAT)-like uncharacterized protein
MEFKSRIRNNKIILKITPYLVIILHFLLFRTCRYRIIGKEIFDKLRGRDENFIYVFWHGQHFIFSYLFRKCEAYVLTSLSRDGQLLAKFLRLYRINSIQGSSTRRGYKAFHELKKILDNGGYVAIAPDGPKGPPNVLAPGVISLAGCSGKLILPMACQVEKSWHLNTWDTLIIPRPFSKIILCFGEPFVVNNLNRENREIVRSNLEFKLNNLNQEAYRLLSEKNGKQIKEVKNGRSRKNKETISYEMQR